MKIFVPELREGSNPVAFPIEREALRGIVRDMDELYDAKGDGDVALDVSKVGGLMHIRGHVRGPISFECARCLADRPRALDIAIAWTLVPRASFAEGLSSEEEIELTADDLDTSFYEGEEIDLMELAREAVLLELEPAPRCADDEACTPSSAVILADAATEPKKDPRWSALQDVLDARKRAN
ncbi:MAG: DUF177 domain-containing protein [Myxococcales bacterium]|nr:DUF177 domain-containing protein [Myxococcales bacterium]MCB9519288.1 DUF177 domain-containing protein [Myxococcales bacterium]MCB9530732.1 DUF177 domain-containing protein [Myxococcales bacterium]MCB9533374.1 DUF177 domain-containing protein [Myxococcales bacterium]